MARTAPRPPPDRERVLETVHRACPACGRRLRYRYDNRHTVTTLAGLVRLRLRIRRCEHPGCARYRRPCRPEAEGALVLPQHESGLDVIALVGALRYRGHRSVPEIHRALLERGVAVCERTVTDVLDKGLFAAVLGWPGTGDRVALSGAAAASPAGAAPIFDPGAPAAPGALPA